MMSPTVTKISLFAAIALSLLGCAAQDPEPTPEEATLIRPGDLAPIFSATTLAGENITVGGEQGRITVLSFFATWCPPCREEFPHLEKDVWQRFRGENFVFLAIAREHAAEELPPFIEEMQVSFPIAPDPTREIYSKFADAFIPRTVVIGADGKVLYHASDFNPDDFQKMVDLIDSELSKLDSAEAEPENLPPEE